MLKVWAAILGAAATVAATPALACSMAPCPTGGAVSNAGRGISSAGGGMRYSTPTEGYGFVAAWNREICVATAGLPGRQARYLNDRIGEVAESVGLKAGGSGCSPNISIVAGHEADQLALRLAARPEGFPNFERASLSERNAAAERARRFQSETPVRWWRRREAVRLPVGRRGALAMASDHAPAFTPVLVLIDTDRLSGVSYRTLADYVAMAALSQLAPGVRSERASVLSAFDGGERSAALTEGDYAFLRRLYRPAPGTGEQPRTALVTPVGVARR